jgi:hypothetical protein
LISAPLTGRSGRGGGEGHEGAGVGEEGEGEGAAPLPDGWEERHADTGRVFFVNHKKKQTTWVDPRTGKKSRKVRRLAGAFRGLHAWLLPSCTHFAC